MARRRRDPFPLPLLLAAMAAVVVLVALHKSRQVANPAAVASDSSTDYHTAFGSLS